MDFLRKKAVPPIDIENAVPISVPLESVKSKDVPSDIYEQVKSVEIENTANELHSSESSSTVIK